MPRSIIRCCTKQACRRLILTGLQGCRSPNYVEPMSRVPNCPNTWYGLNGLERVEEASKKAGNLFIVVLACTLYALLIILSTQDVYLVTSSATFPLPILGTLVPLVWLYWIAPAALLMLFIYFHLNLAAPLGGHISFSCGVSRMERHWIRKYIPWLLKRIDPGLFTPA